MRGWCLSQRARVLGCGAFWTGRSDAVAWHNGTRVSGAVVVVGRSGGGDGVGAAGVRVAAAPGGRGGRRRTSRRPRGGAGGKALRRGPVISSGSGCGGCPWRWWR